ncbi:dihydroorotate oxidase, partial [Necator americanus]
MYSRLPTGYITKSTIIIVSGGVLGYGALEVLWGSETFYRKAVMPVIHKYVDGETAHNLAIKAASWGLLPRFGPNRKEYPELECEFLGKHLSNPIGLAAGFDKNGEAIRPLAEQSGFGLIEVGSITPIPQPGNPKPRVFRLLEDEGVINRYGFNSDGATKVLKRVKAARAHWRNKSAVFGINLGKNKTTGDAKVDYEIGINYFAPYCDYLVINVSSPNTPGLRSMQKKSDLENLLLHTNYVIDAMKLDTRPKVLLKIAPDLIDSERKDIAQVVIDPKYGVDGLIVSNTTISRPEGLASEHKTEAGGLSGAPLRQLSTECVREMYRFTKGQIPIIGCGGIASGEDAYEKIRAGASVVQLYSAFVFQGFPVIGKVVSQISSLRKANRSRCKRLSVFYAMITVPHWRIARQEIVSKRFAFLGSYPPCPWYRPLKTEFTALINVTPEEQEHFMNDEMRMFLAGYETENVRFGYSTDSDAPVSLKVNPSLDPFMRSAVERFKNVLIDIWHIRTYGYDLKHDRSFSLTARAVAYEVVKRLNELLLPLIETDEYD